MANQLIEVSKISKDMINGNNNRLGRWERVDGMPMEEENKNQ